MSTDVQEKPPAQLEAIAEERAITALIHRAARLADDQQYLAWMELFAEDGVYSAITRENAETGLFLFHDVGQRMLHSRVAWLMGLWQVPRGATRHLVTNLEIALETPATASGLASFLITRTGELEMTKLYASGRYHDRFVKTDGTWRFAARHVVLDTAVLPAEGTELL
jgi:3-phenylpropionate/cinnamic acid dioxygenase small subunit